MSRIFISYRRDDSAGYAQAIYGRLAQELSKDRVFMDVDTIEPGVDFERVIEKALDESDIVVALIGRRWMGSDADAASRLDNPRDYVRLEIATALARNIRVIPVLVDGMTMPRADMLPPALRPITRRHAIEISNTRFNFDVERLMTAVCSAFGEDGQTQSLGKSASGGKQPVAWKPRGLPRSRTRYLMAAAGTVAIVLILMIYFVQRQGLKQPIAPESRTGPAATYKVESGKQAESRIPVKVPKPENASATPAVLPAGSVFRDRLKSGAEGPEMVIVPAGSFRMGDVQGGGEKDELPVRAVRIQNSLAVGRYEITFGEYDQFAKATDRQFPLDQGWGRGRRPAIFVSWQDAVDYSKWLSAQTGKRYRLPTEAEWEFTARGGKETAYWWGDNWVKGMANCRGCGSPWGTRTAPVGSFKPNPFGLYDSAGNVWEWVEECTHSNYSGAPSDGSAWSSGGNCVRRMRRGGSWSDPPKNLRSSNRGRYYPDNREDSIGFRVVRDLDW